MAKPPVSEQVQVNFRMPADLRDRLKATAEREGVSMNHLIIDGLERQHPAPSTPESVAEELAGYLGWYDETLREAAIETLREWIDNGTLRRLAKTAYLTGKNEVPF